MSAQFGRRDADDDFELEAPRRPPRPAIRIDARFETADRALVALLAAGVVALIGVGGHLWLQGFGFASDGLTIRHIVAGTGCSEAAMVGLAPAYRGRPGYHAALDPDGDGRSCDAPSTNG